MFTRDIRKITGVELAAAVKHLIDSREPESLRLDYKEKLDISNKKGRLELAKDVSSFANEQGGVLIYGVPEIRGEELPYPKPLAECGLEIEPGLPEQIENILLSAIQPPLHTLAIEIVDIDEITPKQLIVIQPHESYWKPHMVEGYESRRYYRRGNYRSILMNEREVEAAYLARESARTHARDFFDTALFGPVNVRHIRVAICPVMPSRFKARMLENGFLDWLEENRPMGPSVPRKGEWMPFVDGWRFVSVPQGPVRRNEYEIRIFHNGAICLNLDPSKSAIEHNTLLLEELRRDLLSLFVNYSATILPKLSINGPAIARFYLFHAGGLKAAPCTKEFFLRYYTQDVGVGYQDAQHIEFEEETSSDEIMERSEEFMTRLMTRIKAAFGIWETSDKSS